MDSGVLESFKALDNVGEGLIHFQVQIDFDYYHMFATYDELNSLLNQRVLYDVRTDVINGKIEQVIANVSRPNVVNTIAALDNVRLMPENDRNRSVINMDINSFMTGEYQADCIAYFTSYTIDRSNKALWADCIMVDKQSKVFNLKIFLDKATYDTRTVALLDGLVGKYVRFDATLTNYGFQTKEIIYYPIDVVLPPEVEIAAKRIEDTLAGDEVLSKFVQNLDLVEGLKSVVDIEPGYHLVRIAMELELINTLGNISSDYNLQLLRRAAIASRACCLPTKMKYSKSAANVLRAISKGLKEDTELIKILDVFCDEPVSREKAVYIEISKFVDNIIKERRGELVQNESVRLIDEFAIRDKVGQLL